MSGTNTQARWLGQVPTLCETCDSPITKKFYDAGTQTGPWACMCPSCFAFGPGRGKLGTGVGQEYTKKGEHWVKTGG